MSKTTASRPRFGAACMLFAAAALLAASLHAVPARAAEDEGGVAGLVIKLSDTDKYTRIGAVTELESMAANAREAVVPLLELTKDPDAEVRSHTLRALRVIDPGNPAVFAAAVEALEDRETAVRDSAAIILKEMGPGARAAIPALIDCLSDRYSVYCQDALAAVGEAAVDPLADALGSADIYTRENALGALRDIGPPAERVQDRIIAALDDPAGSVRSAARSALTGLNTEKAREALSAFEQAELTREKERDARAADMLNRLYTADDIRADLPAAPDYKYPLGLRDYIESPAGDVVYKVTVHSGKERPDRLAVYGCTGPGCSMLFERYVEDDTLSYYEEPGFFTYGGMLFLHINEKFHGTGNVSYNSIYRMDPDGGMREVEYTSPSDAYKAELLPHEEVRKGVALSLADDGLSFGFYIWNDGDAQCCPTAGYVTGRFEIVEQKPEDGLGLSWLRMVPVDFAREDAEAQ